MAFAVAAKLRWRQERGRSKQPQTVHATGRMDKHKHYEQARATFVSGKTRNAVFGGPTSTTSRYLLAFRNFVY